MRKRLAIILAVGFMAVMVWAYLPTPFPTRLTNGQTKEYTWKYRGHLYTIQLLAYSQIADYYRTRSFKDPGTNDPDQQYWRGIFQQDVNVKDTSIADISDQLKHIAAAHQFTAEDQMELATTFVQSIPYDQPKFKLIEQGAGQQTANIGVAEATWPRAPYETLFDYTGVCTDKSYLLTAILSHLGFGTALIDFPKHMAAAVRCPTSVSINHTGYCYIETTSSGWVAGEEPPTADGTAGTITAIPTDSTEPVDNSGTKLGSATVIPLTDGQVYERTLAISDLLQESNRLTAELNSQRTSFSDDRQKIEQGKVAMNKALAASDTAYRTHLKLKDQASYTSYSALYATYQSAYQHYSSLIDQFNAKVKAFNLKVDRLNEISGKLDYRI